MKLFIGCSSSNNIPKEYFDDCRIILEELMIDNDLVFGASNSGLMGLSYNIALQSNKEVIGICPEAYKDDFKKLECTNEITTNSVGERTEKLIEFCDLIIYLPGGIGTVYEFFASIESKRCHEFNKPILIYNSNGYFDKLLDFMEKLYKEGFSNIKDKENYIVFNSPKEILEYVKNYRNNIN